MEDVTLPVDVSTGPSPGMSADEAPRELTTAEGERLIPRTTSPHWRAALFVFVLCAYLLTGSGRIQTIDVTQTMNVATSMRSGHGFTISAPVVPYGGAVANSRGEAFARHDFGMALIFLPLTFIPGTVKHGLPTERMEFFGSFLDPICGALCVLLFAELLVELGVSRKSTVIAALLLAFATINWPYAHVAFDALPTAACVLFALLGLVRSQQRSDLRWLVGAAAAVGFAIVIRSDTLFLLGPLSIPVIAMLWDARRHTRVMVRTLLAWTLPIAAGMGVTGWYNWVRFGSPFNNGVRNDPSVQMTTPLFHGIRGLLISPGKGLLFFSPLVLIGLWAYPRFIRRHPVIGWTTALTIVAAIVGHARLVDWSGDQAWGPRYLVPVAALFLLPLGMCLDRWLMHRQRHRVALAGLAVVAVLGVTVQVFGVAVDYFTIEARHPGVMATQSYFSASHSQIRYQAAATFAALEGHDPYPGLHIGGDVRRPVPRFDFWWLSEIAWHRRTALAVVGVVLLSLTLVGAGLVLAGGLSTGEAIAPVAALRRFAARQ